MSKNIFKWFLLYCKPREEERGLQNLQNQGYDAFYPTIAVEKVRKGKRSVVNEVLFPSYLFVKLDPDTANFNAIRSTRGVASFVRFGHNHAQIPQQVVDRLKLYQKQCTDFDSPITVAENLPKKGDKVIIDQGIYQGLEAIYQKSDGLERSVLLIKMLEQQASLVINNTEFALKDQVPN